VDIVSDIIRQDHRTPAKALIMARKTKMIKYSVLALVCLGMMPLLSDCRHCGYKNYGIAVIFFTRDNLLPFIMSVKLVDADPLSFEELSDTYACDKHKVFEWGETFDGVDGATCRLLTDEHGNKYILDTINVYCNSFKLEGRDPATFRIIKDCLTEDKFDYYWRNTPLNAKDKKSFVLLNDPEDSDQYYWAKDKYYAYSLVNANRIQIADFDSFRPISAYYAVDKLQVYNRNGVVEGTNPATFKLPDWGAQFQEFYYGDSVNE